MWLYCVGVVLYLQTFANADCPGVVRRKTWDAVNRAHVNYLTRPVDIVVIQHTMSDSCYTDKDCEGIMRALQSCHMDKLNLWDIGSPFYVGGNGKVYEGAGWLYVGAHTHGYNKKSIAISFIGNYNNVEPTTAQLDAVKDLLKCGVEEGHLSKEYHVVGHKQLSDTETESPGRKLYNAIQRWPEWLEDVSSIEN